jgi:4-hydroxy-tetrahydrodipicolinate synthase
VSPHAALEAGTAGALVLPPFYYKDVGDDGLFRFFAEVVERVNDDSLRIYLYHIPQMTGVDLGLPLISRLIDAYPGVVVGTKDSSGDRERIMTLCREFPDFSVLAGTETLLLETLRMAASPQRSTSPPASPVAFTMLTRRGKTTRQKPCKNDSRNCAHPSKHIL